MCLSIPMKLVELEELTGIAEIDGVRREVSLMLLPDPPQLGDWMLVHAGYAISRVDESEARETLGLLRQAADAGVLDWGAKP
jgi:hydrogenase expression/formation protein HypC